MTEELLWSSLVKDGVSEVHVVGDLDVQGAVLAFDDVLYRNVGNGLLDTSAPLTLLRLQSFWDGLCDRYLL